MLFHWEKKEIVYEHPHCKKKNKYGDFFKRVRLQLIGHGVKVRKQQKDRRKQVWKHLVHPLGDPVVLDL